MVVARVILLLALLLLPAVAQAALQYDAASAGKCNGCATLAVSHSVSSGSDRILYISVQLLTIVPGSTSAVEYNGTAATFLGGVTHASCLNGSYPCRSELWRVLAPAPGVHDITVTIAGSAFVQVGGVSFTGAHQTQPEGTLQTGSGTSATPSLTLTSAMGETIVGVATIMNAGSAFTPVNATTLFVDYDAGGYLQYGASYMAGAGATVYEWNYGSAQTYTILAVPVMPATSGGPTPTIDLLRWNDNANNELQFRLRWKHAAQPLYTDLAILAPNTQSYIVNYTTETMRCYQIRAENDGGVSGYSNELCSSSTASGPIQPPLIAPRLGGGLADE